MPIQADVYELKNLARRVRSDSQSIARESRKIQSTMEGIVWKGRACDRFKLEFRPTEQKMTKAVQELVKFAEQLERIAEAFRQADMEEDRRRAREEQERRDQERAAREAERNRK
ncbi:WXG100 family type VII secretion target [Paenibacillus turicensis]|uniref:WXG100 family type VII secretion target n=1 Tax=Paenibacillus turicensis TaxID=160487 RepID=A0ABS4FLE9_9BACL|nr:WXG100 family type VII secretion target [Paenibacillus turicensis]MBP1903394.1 WXG100 family type VII secretion target [Paenibacillus turicensis]